MSSCDMRRTSSFVSGGAAVTGGETTSVGRRVGCAKNAVLPILAASVLANSLHNVALVTQPRLLEVRRDRRLAQLLLLQLRHAVPDHPDRLL